MQATPTERSATPSHAKEVLRSVYEIDDPDTAVEFVKQLAVDLQDLDLAPELNRLGRTLSRWCIQDHRMACRMCHRRRHRSSQQFGQTMLLCLSRGGLGELVVVAFGEVVVVVGASFEF